MLLFFHLLDEVEKTCEVAAIVAAPRLRAAVILAYGAAGVVSVRER